MERRRRREWEAEYVSEYTRAAFPGVPVRYHVRLGTWPTPLTAGELTESEQAMLRVRMRWADAIVIAHGTLVVIEGKLRASEYLKGVSELELYMHLVPHTPELEAFKGARVAGRLVIPIPDPTVDMLARRRGLDVAVFKPTFWTEYTQVLSGRERRPIRPEEASLISPKGGV